MAKKRIDFDQFRMLHGLGTGKPTLRFKEGVVAIEGYWVEAIDPLMQTAPIMQEEEVWVTAIVDGKHKSTSRHFSGDAIDVRFLGFRPGAIWTGSLPTSLPTPTRQAGASCVRAEQLALARYWAARLRVALGVEWDVVVEAGHLHLEHDPK